MNRGSTPYGGMSRIEVVRLLYKGEHLDKPEWCPLQIYKLLQKCWSFSPEKRPSFSSIVKEIDDFVAEIEKISRRRKLPAEHPYYNLIHNDFEILNSLESEIKTNIT